jgi:Tol biopolymer transport system component
MKEGSGLYIIPALGGDARLIAKIPTVGESYGFRGNPFSPDGAWIAYSVGSGLRLSKLFVVPSSGGASREVPVDIPWACCPSWSSDGKHLLVVGSTDPNGNADTFDWWVSPLGGGRAVRTGAEVVFRRHSISSMFGPTPGPWIDEHVFFSGSSADSTNLWRVVVSPGDWQIRKPPERLTTETGREVHPSVALGSSGALRLAFASVAENTNLWSLPINANQGKALGEFRRLTEGAASNTRPSISADGRKLVFLSDRSGNLDVWIKDMQSGKETALVPVPC